MDLFDDGDLDVGPPITDAMIRHAEKVLGYRLPRAYLKVLRLQNGGYLKRCCFPVDFSSSVAPGHINVTQLVGIGHEDGIDGEFGSAYMIAEWGYPDIGVVAFVTDSAGHDTVMFDYSKCGARGEPRIVHVDEDGSVRVVAKEFSSFIKGLKDCSQFAINKVAATSA